MAREDVEQLQPAWPSRLQPVAARMAATGVDAGRVLHALRPLRDRMEVLPAKTILQGEDERMRRPRYLLSGWAYRFTHFADGRRQIFDVVLPGEGVGVCLHARPLALTSVAALTRVELVDASHLVHPDTLSAAPEVSRALEAMADLDDRRLLQHVSRLGRMTALERSAHLLLELRDRLEVIGAVEDDRFVLPLTQELLADLLGLSTVHMNRTMQYLRRERLIETERGVVHLRDRAALARMLPTVTAPPRRATA